MAQNIPQGVMFNAYPDSIGRNLADTVNLLKRPEFKDAFSLFYVLPTFFNSDLDRGFSVIDYGINEELVSPEDLVELEKLNIMLKFDLVLNHLSVGSPQFQHMLQYGDESEHKDFFIDWNEFWSSEGELGEDGHIIPRKEHLDKLFMRKPGLPILKVRYPDGTDRPYWNTFYQEVTYRDVTAEELLQIEGVNRDEAQTLCELVNSALAEKVAPSALDLGAFSRHKDAVIAILEQKRQYLGQMDLNARSEKVWEFYDETLGMLRQYGARLVRLDAFAYLHKQPGEINFFNKPGTWEYLDRLKTIAKKHELILLPEIHSEYGYGLHEEVAAEGFPVYDFFFPGLVIDALDRGTKGPLVRWIEELLEKNIQTINMLGCHDGIPVLDLKGKEIQGVSKAGLLNDEEIDSVIQKIMDRGGRVKNLYGPDGKKISYYQVNATFFSALDEDERKLRMARAIQMFMPGIPQVWYLDLFSGKNNYRAADKSTTAGHKEINRTTLSNDDIEQRMKRIVVRDQLALIRLRNTCPAFAGELRINESEDNCLHLTWQDDSCSATLEADLRNHSFTIKLNANGEESTTSYQ
jgi:sucrose phosphorylase